MKFHIESLREESEMLEYQSFITLVKQVSKCVFKLCVAESNKLETGIAALPSPTINFSCSMYVYSNHLPMHYTCNYRDTCRELYRFQLTPHDDPLFPGMQGGLLDTLVHVSECSFIPV